MNELRWMSVASRRRVALMIEALLLPYLVLTCSTAPTHPVKVGLSAHACAVRSRTGSTDSRAVTFPTADGMAVGSFNSRVCYMSGRTRTLRATIQLVAEAAHQWVRRLGVDLGGRSEHGLLPLVGRGLLVRVDELHH